MTESNQNQSKKHRRLTLQHSEAVSAAKASLLRQLEQGTSPKWCALIERQVELMNDVYWWVLHTIYNPGLPMTDPNLAEDIKKHRESKKNGPETISM